jgi:beta-mannosidase
MFACSFYPRNDAFLDLVRREVAWQVSRLHTHPSIVIWVCIRRMYTLRC